MDEPARHDWLDVAVHRSLRDRLRHHGRVPLDRESAEREPPGRRAEDLASARLIATAIGLVAAIPAVMAYNYFARRVGELADVMDAFAADVVACAKLGGV